MKEKEEVVKQVHKKKEPAVVVNKAAPEPKPQPSSKASKKDEPTKATVKKPVKKALP
jgi:hypothetical protein